MCGRVRSLRSCHGDRDRDRDHRCGHDRNRHDHASDAAIVTLLALGLESLDTID